jgi:hypothetical protein
VIEEWRPAPDADGYEVSSLGRVRRFGRELHLTRTPNGYLQYRPSIKGRRTAKNVHRAVCIAFHGPPPFEGAVARHLDGDRSNNHAGNLAWGTHAQNAADREAHGRTARGASHPRAGLRLPFESVLAIRAARGRTQRDLAKEHGVSEALVSLIVNNKIRTER